MKRAVALGFFDGVHLGHQALLKTLCEQEAYRSVWTFSNHPFSVLAPERTPFFLSAPEEKEALLKAFGAQEVMMPVFDQTMAQMTAESFCGYLFETLQASVVIAGVNHQFGKNAGGNAETLVQAAKRYGAQAVIVQEVRWRGQPVSSSRIRLALEQGNVGLAAQLLGRPYRIPVFEFEREGAFVTQRHRALPKDGVYRVESAFGETTVYIQNRKILPEGKISNQISFL